MGKHNLPKSDKQKISIPNPDLELIQKYYELVESMQFKPEDAPLNAATHFEEKAKDLLPSFCIKNNLNALQQKHLTEYVFNVLYMQMHFNERVIKNKVLPLIKWVLPTITPWGTAKGVLSIPEMHSIFIRNPFCIYNLSIDAILSLARKIASINNNMTCFEQLCVNTDMDMPRCYAFLIKETRKDLRNIRDYYLRPLEQTANLFNNHKTLASIFASYNRTLEYIIQIILMYHRADTDKTPNDFVEENFDGLKQIKFSFNPKTPL